MELGKHSYAGQVRELFYPVVTTGKFCAIADDVTFMGLCQHPPVYNRKCVASFPFMEVWGDAYSPSSGLAQADAGITLGNDVWVGNGAMFMSPVTVGDGAIIGARSVVRKNVPAYAVAFGNPAIVWRYRFPAETIARLLQIKWWDWGVELIKRVLPLMQDVDQLLAWYDDEYDQANLLKEA